jgi:hypothetical protein
MKFLSSLYIKGGIFPRPPSFIGRGERDRIEEREREREEMDFGFNG